MSSSDLLIEPEAAVRSNEVVQNIFTIGSDRKVNDVPREPGFQALHPSPSTADRKEATKPKKAHGRKNRNPKKGKVGSGRGTPRTTDQRAGNKAIATTDTSSKKTDAAPVGSTFHSSSKWKRLDAEKSPAVSSMQESVVQEASASQVVAPSDSKNETGEAHESKKLPVISDEAAHSSSVSCAFAQSCFPEAAVLKRKEGSNNADAGRVSGRGSPASSSKTSRPTQPLVCDPSPAPYYAAESSRNMPEGAQDAATAEKRGGPGKDSSNGDAFVIKKASTGSSGQLSPSSRVSSPSPIAVRAGKLPADAPVLVPPEPLADTSESENSAPWHGRIMKTIKHDSVSTGPEKKHRPVPPNVKSRYSGTADYQVTLARLRLGLFADDPDEATRSSQLHRAWVLLPLAVLIVALAVVLAARKHRGAYMASTFYLQNESGVCTTEACRRVVAIAAQNTDAEFNPCVDFHRHACGRWFAGRTARRSYADENWLNFTAAAHLALSQLPLTLEPGLQDS